MNECLCVKRLAVHKIVGCRHDNHNMVWTLREMGGERVESICWKVYFNMNCCFFQCGQLARETDRLHHLGWAVECQELPLWGRGE